MEQRHLYLVQIYEIMAEMKVGRYTFMGYVVLSLAAYSCESVRRVQSIGLST